MLTIAGLAAVQSPTLRVLGVQLAASSGTERNLEHAASLIRENPGFSLYVLPELSSHGYSDAILADASAHAEDALDGKCADFFRELSAEVNAHICYGFLRRTEAGRITICQAVAAPTDKPERSLSLVYDKMHLCDMGACSEVGYGLERGAAPGTFEVNGFRVGVTVCCASAGLDRMTCGFT